MTWLPTYTGKVVDLLDPRPEQIDLADIAIGLSRIPRYYGQSRVPWTVAEHSVLVAEEVRRQTTQGWPGMDALAHISDLRTRGAPVYALLHDAHEAYTGDLISPLKRLIGAETDILERIEQGLDRAIYAALELEPPSETICDLVRHHDLRALVTERRDLLGPQKRLWSRALDDVLPYPDVTLVPNPSEAERREEWLTDLFHALHRAGAADHVLQLVFDARRMCRAIPDPGY